MRKIYKTTVRRSVSAMKFLLWRRRITNIALIFMLIGVFLGQDVAYPSDMPCLRIPIAIEKNRKTKALGEVSEITFTITLPAITPDKTARREEILQKDQKDLEHLEMLKRVAQKANTKDILKVLRPSTRKIFKELFKNPKSDLLDVVQYDEELYYENRAVLFSKWGGVLLEEYPEIFNSSLGEGEDQLRGLIERIIQACALKEAKLSEDGLDVLYNYLTLPYDMPDIASAKISRAIEFQLFKKHQEDTDVIIKYGKVIYEFKKKAYMWIDRILPPEYKTTNSFGYQIGYGDEHELLGGFGTQMVLAYKESQELISLDSWHVVGGARYYTLHNDISDAVAMYISVLTKNKHSPHAISVIKDEIRWMDENGIEGTEQIANALHLGKKPPIIRRILHGIRGLRKRN